jgi:CheY-like chemotaxis protein
VRGTGSAINDRYADAQGAVLRRSDHRVDDLRHGRIEPEALAGGEPPDLILYDLDEPVDESLPLLTLFRSLPGMGGVPVLLLRTAQTPLPPLDGPGIVAVLTRPCEAALARTIIDAALRDGRGLDEAA